MVDGGGEGGSPMTRLAGTVPSTLFNLVQTAQAMGLDVSALLGKLGIRNAAPDAPKSGE